MVDIRVNSEGISECTITNASGASVTLSALGGRIVSVKVPDREGEMADIIAKSHVSEHCPVFGCRAVDDVTVVFTLSSSESIEYRWTDDCTLETYLSSSAVGHLPVCFDLDGKVADQYLWVNALSAIDTAGETVTVKDTPLDFTSAKPADVAALGDGVKYRIADWESGLMIEVAVLASHVTGREVRIYSTYPVCEIRADGAGICFDCLNPDADDGPQLIFYEFSRI